MAPTPAPHIRQEGPLQDSPSSLNANWVFFGLRGILAVLFGALALSVPVTALTALTALFGAFALLDGFFHLLSGFRRAQRGRGWGGLMAPGVMGILAGVALLAAPKLAAIGLTLFVWMIIAAWAVATGLGGLAMALRLRRETGTGSLGAAGGTLSLVLGLWMVVMLVTRPQDSLPALGMMIGLFALASGFLLLLLARALYRMDGPAQGVAGQRK